MRELLPVALLVALLAVPRGAAADRHSTEQGKMSWETPSSWRVAFEGGSHVNFSPNREAVVALTFFEGFDERKLKQAFEEGFLTKQVMDGKWTSEFRDVTVGGMRGFRRTATALSSGKEVVIVLAAFRTPENKGMLFVGQILKSKRAKHERAVERAFSSLRPIE